MNELEFITTVDQYGLFSYELKGELIDEDAEPFTVGEFTFNPARARSLAKYYEDNFGCRLIRREVKEGAV